MRIRTIKPEFWTHPVIVRLEDPTKLLALGLLNYADDHGYFYAPPAMVRAALRPLDEDSTIVRRALDDLSRIGYIEVRNHSTHGELGLVVSFGKHQRVDRPAQSKISLLWEDSTIIRRTIVEGASTDLGNRGTGEQGNKTPPPKPVPTPEPPAEPPKVDKLIPATPEAQAIATLFRRRPTTPWSEKEHRSYRAAFRTNLITPDNLQAIFAYYEHERTKGGDGQHRRDLFTFLNNFSGELDRALAFSADPKAHEKTTHQHRNGDSGRNVGHNATVDYSQYNQRPPKVPDGPSGDAV